MLKVALGKAEQLDGEQNAKRKELERQLEAEHTAVCCQDDRCRLVDERHQASKLLSWLR